jgi:glycosyltransferase EpsD
MNMKKSLYVATVDMHIKSFHIPYLKMLQESGYETHVASNGDMQFEYADKKFNVCFARSPYNFSNLKAYRQLKKIIDENNYDFIHCHTPVGAALTRLAARKARTNGTKVIYTAHGFHFFKGAPLFNWLFYYPAERWLARYTDVLITINKEDFNRAQKFRAKKIEYIPGVGIDIKKFSPRALDREAKRKELGFNENDVVLLSVGELSKNKNHSLVIRSLAKIKKENLKYIICGSGSLEKKLCKLISKLKLETKVFLLGLREDISDICNAADIFVFPSKREGLSVALTEAMAASLPVVCSDIRGNSDLITNGKGGFLVDPENIAGFAEAIEKLFKTSKLRYEMGLFNRDVVKAFDIDYLITTTKNTYNNTINKEGF